jgi:hypothetical protein
MQTLLSFRNISAAFVAVFFTLGCQPSAQENAKNKSTVANEPAKEVQQERIDTARYDSLMKILANGDTSGRWPVKAPYPLKGAVLPFNRIIAYYGNLYSVKMGILGELPEAEMTARLKGEVAKWTKADPEFPAVPALHYIASVAQGDGGKDGKFRYRMPFAQIDKVIAMAKKINALVFLDIQVSLSNLQTELPLLEKYLSMPNVHLGIDPEFSMKTGAKPGTVIGTFDAVDINYACDYLTSLVKKYNLPPKVLIVHRFTRKMVTNADKIKTRPELQIVMDMDGWGEKARKISTYRLFIQPEPVQFTGFKIFYKNDTKRVNKPREMQPEDVLPLRPRPIYIQYQ